jgi:hypothetical protein
LLVALVNESARALFEQEWDKEHYQAFLLIL